MHTLVAILPRLALIGLAGVYVWTGSPWMAVIPLVLAAWGLGMPRVY